ncbi:hypothetical protein BKA82DRAFT_532300 [Pisolithus tinctorius]|uniref:Uncharacterized protein n=1 Tax=Pisolithus tinctorius Marx 270 TaxID=870435 RepID=A0A0C3K611_PISTI|nr:hypothetical protein BKA82DRAFT_532300 [Pisolithus tinctorius]KIO05027.1 hypothetical protein M404DRAFT_532300 [Pisolithus tinctorius Marx 270]
MHRRGKDSTVGLSLLSSIAHSNARGARPILSAVPSQLERFTSYAFGETYYRSSQRLCVSVLAPSFTPDTAAQWGFPSTSLEDLVFKNILPRYSPQVTSLFANSP